MLRFLLVVLVLLICAFLFVKFVIPAILLLLPGVWGTILIAVIVLLVIIFLLNRYAGLNF